MGCYGGSPVWTKNPLEEVSGVALGQAVTLGLNAVFPALNKTLGLWEFLFAE